ncbi:DUF2690 domain-containing protein [Streptomyces sp. NPDC051546]|uniref:DUF2690 domain-containing protein n=1 Tax=Streptomyces sp. NPDC051546 TaxID=3365655 RepID=UPI00379DB1ED
MYLTKKAAVLASTVALVAGAGVMGAPTASAAVECGGQANATTVKSVKVDNATVELRYSASTRCAWARVSGAHVNDLVWVDRTSNNAATWDSLEIKAVTSGTDAFTLPYSDKGYKMRACADLRSTTGHWKCTGWY